MKVLHVAVFTPQSTNVWQANGFEEMGCEVIRYDYRQKARDLDGKLGNYNPKRDADLIERCKQEKPDIILFSKCNQMESNVVEECGKVGKTVLWYMDNFNNINQELIQKMEVCDYIFCSTPSGLETGKRHNKNTYKLKGGYDSKIHRPADVPKLRDVCFIGGMYPYRMPYYSEVGFPVFNNVYNEDHSRTISETRINLNFTEGDGVSNRIYKIMAAGGFLLSSPWRGLEEDFEVGVHLDVFRTPQELKEKISYYLKHEKERERIAQAGREQVKQWDDVGYAREILEVVS